MRLLLSCISTQHSMLKQHWSQTRQQVACPLTTLGSQQKPDRDPGGLLCMVDEAGVAQNSLNLAMAAGIVSSEKGWLVTTFNAIHEVDACLHTVQLPAITSPLFNALHSISRTQHGYLVASTGLDLLLEFDRTGKLLWSWWAIDHGFERTPTGERRRLDKDADHSTERYGTLQQTTHVNSVAELPDGRILATLFHQGMVIAIDRETGRWHPVVEGLDHPHSVRVLDEQYFTVADTVRGHGLLIYLDKVGGSGSVEEEVNADTGWLQDCSYDPVHDTWVLVDGQRSRVLLHGGRAGDKPITQYNFDPEWRLYEAHLLH